jgi:hypothetical protein
MARRVRSTLPYDPRTDRIADAGWLGVVGRGAIQRIADADQLLRW